MKIEVSYGNEKIGFDIPKHNLAGIIRPGKQQPPLTAEQINTAICRSDCAAEFIKSVQDKKLCVLVPDGTRDLPIKEILNSAACLLHKPQFIRFMICTGTHNARTERNELLIEQIKSLMRENGINNFDIAAHDCEKDEFINAGTTSRQTEILYNSAIKECDVFLALSDVKHHYFAGYSNPVKNLVPGLCAFKTVEQNHSLSLDNKSRFGAHPWHPAGNLQDNPLAADQLEAAEKILGKREFWAIVMISYSNKVQWVHFAKAKEAAAKAFEIADQWNVFNVKPVQRMIVSCGGMPNDIDLYIAQRALELTKQAIIEGGEILFVAACDKGIGAERTMPHFWNLLIKPIDEIFSTVCNNPYKLFSHKPLRFAEMIKNLRKLWLLSKLPDDSVISAHMHPAHDVQNVVDGWIDENPDEKILVVDGANKIAIRSEH
ncbi:MAG: lactate racemase domain-containing protein [Phycisphaerales bacterium]